MSRAYAYQGMDWICETCGYVMCPLGQENIDSGKTNRFRWKVKCTNERCPHYSKPKIIPLSAAVELEDVIE